MMKFLSLILVCSLVKLSIAEPAEKKPLSDCGTTYKCYVPETCTTDDPSKTTFSATTKIIEAQATTPVTKDCAAIIRFHLFAEHWMRVSIESLAPSTQSISFKHISSSDENVVFECKIDNSEVKGKYTSPAVTQEKAAKNMIASSMTPLRCAFNVLVNKMSKVVDAGPFGRVQLTIETVSSAITDEIYLATLQCDPSMFKYKPFENVNPQEKYAEFQYSPGVFTCSGKVFTRMEYRPADSDSYATVTKLECQRSKFLITVGGSSVQEIPRLDYIYIRCVADAQYFCNYKVKTISGPSSDPSVKAPVQQLPNTQTPQKGEINCPPTHQFIEVNGKPFIDGKIKCQNNGYVTRWTINRKGKDEILRKDKDEVRCVNELKCHKMSKIPASSIRKGTLINHLPTCRNDGILKVTPNMDTVTKVYCDKLTGKYMYTTGTQTIAVGNATFICEYPPKIDHRMNKAKQDEALATGAITTAGIVVGSFVAFSVGVFLASYLRIRIIKKRMAKKDKKMWDAYCAKGGENEEKRGTQKDMNGASPESQPNNDPSRTHDFLLSMRQEALNCVAIDGVLKWLMCIEHTLASLTTATIENVKAIWDKLTTKGLEIQLKSTSPRGFEELENDCSNQKTGTDKIIDFFAPDSETEKSAKDLDENVVDNKKDE